jgi:recombination protein RecR
MNGVGPHELRVETLIGRIDRAAGEIKEVILALSPTMEGDTTAFYLNKKLNPFTIKISAIARGIPVGGDLEYTDEVTLGRSITGRTLFN